LRREVTNYDRLVNLELGELIGASGCGVYAPKIAQFFVLFFAGP